MWFWCLIILTNNGIFVTVLINVHKSWFYADFRVARLGSFYSCENSFRTCFIIQTDATFVLKVNECVSGGGGAGLASSEAVSLYGYKLKNCYV